MHSLGDSRVLAPILTRLTSTAKLPILLIGGKPISTDDLDALQQQQVDIKQLITDAGAVIGGGRKRKQGKMAQE